MGVEKFFNKLVSSYKSKLITTFNTTNGDILFFDFNSIIHKISSQVISDLNYLYKILLIASNYPSPKLINFFENKYKTYKDIFYLSIDFIYTPFGIQQLINDLKKIDINIIIIHQVIKAIEYYINKINGLQLVYISLDGVPSIGKIMEQRHRRYIGEIINYKINKKINTFNFPTELSEEYPFDYIQYNQTKFSFLKLNISPGTKFMKELVTSIKNHQFPVNLQINDDTISGEGEFKIIHFINIYKNLFLNKKIIIYSPDADMILLSSILELDINIIRYDQQQNQDLFLSTEIFKLLLTEYIDDNKKIKINQNIVNDIIFIFTIFGDDFLPRLEAIQVNLHYEKILNIYKNIYINNGYIIQDNKLNLPNLIIFFKELKELEVPNLLSMFDKNKIIEEKDKISETISYIKMKKSSFNKDPLDNKIINDFNKDIHDSNYLEEKYSVTYYLYPKNIYYKKYEINQTNAVNEYINGLIWIFNYYFNNDLNYSWYYPYEKPPFIEDIYDGLLKLKSIDLSLKKDTPLLFTPIEQAIYTSPIEITNLLTPKYQNMTKKFYKKYDLSNILENLDTINCDNSNYLSKCSLLNIEHPIYKLSPKEFIKEFRSDSTSKEFIKLVKYYEITNDPYFYNIIEKKLNS
jgi:5'-3' exonuclease